jgi:DNA processing protein
LEKLSQLALVFTSGIGDVLARYLISYCGSAEAVFKTPKTKLLKIPNIGEVTAAAILSKEGWYKAENQLNICEKNEIEVLFYTDKNYPDRLKNIADAPVLLFYKGTANLNASKVVSVVGTRKSTSYGKTVTEEIIEGLKKFQDIQVVSGLAFGIDVIAHKAALKQSIPTIGVMATGHDTIYPAVHKQISTQMLEQGGGLLTEYSWGTKTEPGFFPARNRIIAGLADAVIVVEAAKAGGALITAEIANSYNKDVFAIPGNLGNTYSEGCNNLIKTHKANLMMGVKDLEYIIYPNNILQLTA